MQASFREARSAYIALGGAHTTSPLLQLPSFRLLASFAVPLTLPLPPPSEPLALPRPPSKPSPSPPLLPLPPHSVLVQVLLENETSFCFFLTRSYLGRCIIIVLLSFLLVSRVDMPTKTASTCTVETAQGVHAFHISRYSSTKGLGVGRFVRSCAFNVGGYDWAIRYYPDGSVGDHLDYIAVYVELMSKGADVRASYELKLVNQTTGLSYSVFRASKVFNGGKSTKFAWGSSTFAKRSALEASAYVRDDGLTIECDVTVFNEPKVSETKLLSEIEVPPSDITEHFGRLLEEEEGKDVSFSVRGETIAAHRVVLAARSPVFKAELYGPMRESKKRRITVDDMQPVVFRSLLHFIYTDSLPIMDDLGLGADDSRDMIRHLLVAADRYAMERLKLMCEQMLCGSLDVETVATTLALADQHHCSRLKDACVEFIVSSNRMADVMATKGYEHLKSTCPSVLLSVSIEILHKIGSHRKI